MDEASVTITGAAGEAITFERRNVAIVKPVVELKEEDFADAVLDGEE